MYGNFNGYIKESIQYANLNDTIQLAKDASKYYTFIPSVEKSAGIIQLLFGIGFGYYGTSLNIMNDNMFFLQLFLRQHRLTYVLTMPVQLFAAFHTDQPPLDAICPVFCSKQWKCNGSYH